MRDAWHRLGEVSAVTAFVALFSLGGTAIVVFSDAVGATIVIALLIAYVAYCAARPHHRLGVLLYAGAPGAAGTIAHDLVGTSRLWGLLMVPIVVSALQDIDKSKDRRASARSDRPSPSTGPS
jgi:hypothetical protein